MNKEVISDLISKNVDYFKKNTRELGFFIYHLVLLCEKDNVTPWSTLNISDDFLESLIDECIEYTHYQIGDKRGFVNSFEGKKDKTCNDWVMVLKSKYPLKYKQDSDCLKEIFLSVYFSNPWRDGFLVKPLSKKSTLSYEDLHGCENLASFEDSELSGIAKQISSDKDLKEFKEILNHEFKKFMDQERQIETLTDRAMYFMEEKERYRPVDFSQINYMPIRTMPENAHPSYVEGAVKCLMSIIYNKSETSKNISIAQKELKRMKDKYINENK